MVEAVSVGQNHGVGGKLLTGAAVTLAFGTTIGVALGTTQRFVSPET